MNPPKMASWYCENALCGYWNHARPSPTRALLNDPEWSSDRSQRVRSPHKLLPLVGGRDDRPQPRLPLGHGRVAHCRSKHAVLEQFFRELIGLRGLPHVDRDDRRLAHLELEASFVQLLFEELRIGPQLFDPPF